MKADNYCVLIPGYNEAGRIGRVVENVRKQCKEVVVVDDGSKDTTAEEARKAGAYVIVHEVNKGKGAAINTGIDHAISKDYEFVITMDADGQHDPQEISGFISEFRRSSPDAVIGNRMYDPKGMPFVRRMTNYFMSWLVSREMGQKVPDISNGFRLYSRKILPYVKSEHAGFASEQEVLLRLSDAGAKISSAPVTTIYGDEKSKIHPVRDTLRFFAMLRKHRREKIRR